MNYQLLKGVVFPTFLHLRFAEVALIIHFITLALLWLFRDPKFIDGWAIVFKKGYDLFQ